MTIYHLYNEGGRLFLKKKILIQQYSTKPAHFKHHLESLGPPYESP